MKKKSAGDINHNFAHVYQKQQLHEAQFLRYGVRQTDFGPFFHFYNLTTHKIKNLKKGKSIWKYYHFTCAYQNAHSYVCFLRYVV